MRDGAARDVEEAALAADYLDLEELHGRYLKQQCQKTEGKIAATELIKDGIFEKARGVVRGHGTKW